MKTPVRINVHTITLKTNDDGRVEYIILNGRPGEPSAVFHTVKTPDSAILYGGDITFGLEEEMPVVLL